MKNNLADLANILFDQIGKLDELDINSPRKIKNEILISDAKLELAKGIIEIGKLQLQAQKELGGYRRNKDEIIPELIEAKRTAGRSLPPAKE